MTRTPKPPQFRVFFSVSYGNPPDRVPTAKMGCEGRSLQLRGTNEKSLPLLTRLLHLQLGEGELTSMFSASLFGIPIAT